MFLCGECEVLEHELFAPSPSTAYVKVRTHGDGSCFFHSLAIAMNFEGALRIVDGDQRRAVGLHLRECLITQDGWRRFISSLSSDVRLLAPLWETVRLPTTYSCDFVLSFVSSMYYVNIMVLSSDGTLVQKIKTRDSPTVFILHSSDDHFEPVVRVRFHPECYHGIMCEYSGRKRLDHDSAAGRRECDCPCESVQGDGIIEKSIDDGVRSSVTRAIRRTFDRIHRPPSSTGSRRDASRRHAVIPTTSVRFRYNGMVFHARGVFHLREPASSRVLGRERVSCDR
jgi:hypothetical protein